MTTEDYQAGIDLIQLKAAEHPLLKTLQKGLSPINVLYLKQLLGDLRQKIADEASISIDDPLLRNMYIQKSDLFGQRAKCSNTFHDCDTDEQRAAVSEQVQLIQRQIETVMQQIDYYCNNGKLPEQEPPKKYAVPLDPYEQIKVRNSLRSAISRYKRKLEQLVVLPDNAPERAKIAEIEEKLKEKKIHLTHVEKAIAKAVVITR